MSSRLLIFLSCVASFGIAQKFNFNVCGVSYNTYFSPHIVGGKASIDGDWPWVVSIHANGRKHCTGSIISNKHVLSAAHCYFGITSRSKDDVDFSVHAGSKYASGGEVVKVSKIHMYDAYSYGDDIRNDIAIFELDRPLVFNRNISKVCLAKAFHEEEDDVAFLAGFGHTWNNRVKAAIKENYVLRSTTISFQSFKYCNKTSKNWNYIEDNYICGGAHMSGSSDGDSGGPLMIKRKILSGRPKMRWFEVGVVVGGRYFNKEVDKVMTEEKWSETLYSRVSAYCEWIGNVTENAATCMKFRD